MMSLMGFVLVFCLLSVILAMVLYIIIAILFKGIKESREAKRETEEWEERRFQKRKIWNERVSRARRHLRGTSWKDPAGKKEFVKELFEGNVPQYLWYEINRKLTEEDIRAISIMMWGRANPSFGDLEMHRTLRVRNADSFSPLLLDEFPLVQIGYLDFWDAVDEHGFPEGVVLFSVEGFYPSVE